MGTIDPHEEKEKTRIQKALNEAMSILQDAGATDVAILCSWNMETGNTAMHTKFLGSWYATTGMMAYMVNKRNASAFLEAQDDHQSNTQDQ